MKKFNQLVNYKHFKMESIKMTLIYLSQMCIWHLLTTKMHFFFRSQRCKSVVYVDDSYLQWNTYQSCLANILGTTKLLRELRFVIQPDKSVLTPRQTIFILGFVISSKHMILSLTDEKKKEIKAYLLIVYIAMRYL